MTTQERHWILGGGLASGKSLVRATLEESGIATIDADAIGHEVLEPDGPAFPAVAARWPDVVADGAIFRPALAEVVFGDPEALRILESITHPYIFDTIRARVEEIEGSVVVEVPVLSHRLGPDWKRVVVDCRVDARLERAVERGMTEADARARIAAQPSRSEWLAAADLVVPNHDGVDALRQAATIVARLLGR